MMLTISGLHTHYGRIEALQGVDLEVGNGEIVTLIGANAGGRAAAKRLPKYLQPVPQSTGPAWRSPHGRGTLCFVPLSPERGSGHRKHGGLQGDDPQDSPR